MGTRPTWRAARTIALGVGFAAMSLATAAQTPPTDMPLYGCHTADNLGVAMTALDEGDRAAFDALFADDRCLSLDGREYTILETQLTMRRARIRLKGDADGSVLWTDLNAVGPM